MTCLEIWETTQALRIPKTHEQRVASLLADLNSNRAALGGEHDQTRLVERLKRHVALQDALLAELLPGHIDGDENTTAP